MLSQPVGGAREQLNTYLLRKYKKTELQRKTIDPSRPREASKILTSYRSYTLYEVTEDML